MNLPNKLTIIRIALVPVLVLVYLFPFESYSIQIGTLTFMNTSINYIDITCLIIFLIASITDYFDGEIARKQNLITTFGKFVDPIADKLLVNSLLLLLAFDQRIPVYLVILMIGRDTVVDAVRFFASSSNRVLPANIWGKLKTVCQMIAILLVLMNNALFTWTGLPIDQIMIYIATIVSLISGWIYFNQNLDLIMESM